MEEDFEFLDQDRFQGATVFVFGDTEGTVDVAAPEWVQPDNFKFVLHKVVAGQTLDRIAYEHYNDKVQYPSQYWWLIAQANDIERPWDLSGWEGKDLVIPDIYQFQVNRQ